MVFVSHMAILLRSDNEHLFVLCFCKKGRKKALLVTATLPLLHQQLRDDKGHLQGLPWRARVVTAKLVLSLMRVVSPSVSARQSP